MKKTFNQWLGFIVTLLFILSFAIFLTIWNIPLYQLTLKVLKIPQQVGLSSRRILQNYLKLLNYLHNPWLKQLHLPDFTMSAAGRFHFYEVKRLFLFNLMVLIGTGLFSLSFWKKERQAHTVWQFHATFKRLLVVPILIGMALMIGFDEIFVLFHEVLFGNDYWLFDPAVDPIINVLPEQFFLLCFLSVFLWTELFLGWLCLKTKPKGTKNR